MLYHLEHLKAINEYVFHEHLVLLVLCALRCGCFVNYAILSPFLLLINYPVIVRARIELADFLVQLLNCQIIALNNTLLFLLEEQFAILDFLF